MSIASVTLSADVGQYMAAMQRAAAATQQASARIASSVGTAGAAVGAILGSGVVVSIGAMVTGTIDAAGAFQDLSDATGASIENISGLDALARRTGHSFDTAASLLVKFNSVLKEAKPGSDGERALQAIGLSVRDLRNEDPAEALRLVSLALQGYENDANKARLVQELFGKSIREVAPLLNDMAEGGKLAAKVSVEQVDAADKLGKQFAALKADAEDLKREIAMGLVPAMSTFVQTYRDKGFMAALDDFGERTFKWSSNTQQKRVDDLKAEIADLQSASAEIKFDIFAVGKRSADQLVLKRRELAAAEQELLRISAAPYTDSAAGGGRGSAQKAPDSAFGPGRTVGNLDGPDKAAAAAEAAESKARLDADVAAIGNRLKQLQQDYKGAERIMEAERSAGLVSERDYYAEKRSLLELNAAAEIRALGEENARLAAVKASGKDRIELDKKIAENASKMIALRKEADSSQVVLSIQQRAALKSEEASFISARQAAESYLATLQLRYTREVRSQGLGDLARQYDTGRNEIDDRGEQQLRELENRRRLLEAQRDSSGNSLFTETEKGKYDRELALIQEFQGRSVSAYDQYWADLRAAQGSWELGASEAWSNYRDASANALVQTRDLVSRTFSGMEDALVTFATTGKLSFTDLANSIVADLIRIQVRASITSAIGGSGGIFGSLFGGGSSSGLGAATAADVRNAGPGLMFLSDGGYTGPGGKYVPRGIVHAGEIVWSQDDIARHGGVGEDESLRTGRGYADGGVVGGGRAPLLIGQRSSAMPSMNVAVLNYGSSKVTTQKQQRADGGFDLVVMIDALESAVADRVQEGRGALNAAFAGRYGLKPAMG